MSRSLKTQTRLRITCNEILVGTRIVMSCGREREREMREDTCCLSYQRRSFVSYFAVTNMCVTQNSTTVRETKSVVVPGPS